MADKNKPQVTKSPKAPESGNAEAPTPAAAQLAAFEGAMRLFHARKLSEARGLFLQASAGPGRDVAQRAQLHIAMCDRRLEQGAVSFGSAEEYYNYGVALLNLRNAVEARTHMEKALSIAPAADHIHYAMALAHAMTGDLAGAHDNLRRAIELDPRNRMLARQDVDFAPLANQAAFRTLLYPEKKSW
jgi:tetratricopeptide (TPR) repeat protein